jgi:hypothetical protein
MAFPVGSRTTGELITASIWNADLKDNLNTVRAGGIAIASQAAGDVAYATSATQWGRVNGTGMLRLNGSGAATVTPAPFKSYTTAAAANTITISSLDLNADLAYDIVLETGNFGAAEAIQCRINNDTTGDQYVAARYVDSGTADGVHHAAAQTTMRLDAAYPGGVTAAQWCGRLGLQLGGGGQPHLNFHLTGIGGTGVIDVNGSATKLATTNVTSLRLYSANSNTADWRVWVFRAPTS